MWNWLICVNNAIGTHNRLLRCKLRCRPMSRRWAGKTLERFHTSTIGRFCLSFQLRFVSDNQSTLSSTIQEFGRLMDFPRDQQQSHSAPPAPVPPVASVSSSSVEHRPPAAHYVSTIPSSMHNPTPGYQDYCTVMNIFPFLLLIHHLFLLQINAWKISIMVGTLQHHRCRQTTLRIVGGTTTFLAVWIILSLIWASHCPRVPQLERRPTEDRGKLKRLDELRPSLDPIRSLQIQPLLDHRTVMLDLF